MLSALPWTGETAMPLTCVAGERRSPMHRHGHESQAVQFWSSELQNMQQSTSYISDIWIKLPWTTENGGAPPQVSESSQMEVLPHKFRNQVTSVRSFTWYRAWVAAHRCRQLIMMHTFQNMWAIYPMANGFPCWFAQTPAASSSVVKEMLERQGLETVSQHRQGQMIEDAIRKAFAEFGECSEVRSASEFGGPLDFPKNAVLGYLISLSHKYVVLRWDFTMHSCRGRCDSNHPGPRKPRWIS